MASVPDVAGGCAKILWPLLYFLGESAPRSPAVDEAVISIFVVLSMAYTASVIVERFASVVLAYLHLAAPAPATAASSVHQGKFVGPCFALVFAWLLVTTVLLAAFFFLGAGKPGTAPGSVQLESAGLNPA